jgi:hypothetical protein
MTFNRGRSPSRQPLPKPNARAAAVPGDEFDTGSLDRAKKLRPRRQAIAG